MSCLRGNRRDGRKVVLVHVEMALEPLHECQKTLDEIKTQLGNYGLDPIGSNISSNQNWGDVVFCRRNLIKSRFKDVCFDLQVAKLQYFLERIMWPQNLKRFLGCFKIFAGCLFVYIRILLYKLLYFCAITLEENIFSASSLQDFRENLFRFLTAWHISSML